MRIICCCCCDAEGLVVGLTETGWDPRKPDRVWQQLTATDRAWRGKRGLARALKAAMFRYRSRRITRKWC